MLKIYLFVFGAVVLGGAIQGFLAGSKASLIAGGILGLFILAGGFLLQSNPTLGLILATVGAVGIAGRFVPAFLKAADKAAAIWPAGVLSVLAVVCLVLTIMGFVKK